MYNSDTELLFPLRVLPGLRSLRGEEWCKLVDRVSKPDAAWLDRVGMVLMMVRLSGCTGCDADSYRAMRGCTQCSRQTIRRYKGSDPDLVTLFVSAQKEAEQYIKSIT